MDDGGTDDRKPVDGAAVLSEAFPDLTCLRCGYGLHYYSVEHDPMIALGFGDGEVLHTVCRRCGYHERHVLTILRNAVKNGAMPVSSEPGTK